MLTVVMETAIRNANGLTLDVDNCRVMSLVDIDNYTNVTCGHINVDSDNYNNVTCGHINVDIDN